MSSTYKTRAGDTFDVISRRVYGEESGAADIITANPGLIAPFRAGILITIPERPELPKDRIAQGESSVDSEVAILIDGQRFRFWESISLTDHLDSIQTLTFTAPFDPSDEKFRQIFKPFSYRDVVVTVGGNTYFTGTLLNVSPSVESDRSVVVVQAYSKPGVLADCTLPASSYPQNESSDQTLEEIAQTMAKPFGIGVTFFGDNGGTIQRAAIDPGQDVFSYLVGLAKQKNLLLSSRSNGDLLFSQAIDRGIPIARLEQGQSPLTSVGATFSPQVYFSHITGISPTLVGEEGAQFTYKNENLSGVTRPTTFNATDTQNSNIKKAVDSKAARMFGNMVSYQVGVSTWKDQRGVIWEPNNVLELRAPGAMIYRSTEFLIRSVSLNKDSKSESATLELCLLGSFTDRTPRSLPWE